MLRTLLLLLLVLPACLVGDGATRRASRQLAAAEETARDVLKIAQEDAPELVGALEAIADGLQQAGSDLRAHGDREGIASCLVLVESAIALSVDAPRIVYALVAVKGALLQLEASR